MAQAERSHILWFADLSLADRSRVGGKSASLGELVRASIPVPPGFAITTAAFETFLAAVDPAGEIRTEVSALDKHNSDGIATASRHIRQRIRESAVPDAIAADILSAYRALQQNGSGCPVAVRSSATCEDSAEASFAGLQDTYLWILGEQALIDQVRACWASLYNNESITYRLRLGVPEHQLSMSVVVQQMVDAACAGIMFTRSPTTGDKSVIVIEGSWGLGSCIVSGEVTPDRFVVNKVTGEINTRNISAKTAEHVPDRSSGGVLELAIDEPRCSAPCLDDDTIRRLWQIGRQVELHYGCPQDIEWAVPRDAGEEPVYLLQSRPETVWSGKEKDPKARPAARHFDHVINLMSARKSQR